MAEQKIRLTRARGAMPRITALGQHSAPYEDVYHSFMTLSWPVFFGLIGCLFLLVNALFAVGYLVQPGGVANARAGSLTDAFFFSVQTMATIGYGGMYPVSMAAHVLVTMEALCGMVGVALVTGLTYAKFARARARVLFCDKAVVTRRSGVPHLMFRMANWRHNYVVEAQLKVILLCSERTPEGEALRVPVELPLVRDRTALFILTWTAMHRIDEKSPLYRAPGETAADVIARLRRQDAELYLNLSGQDETFGQTIHARYRYDLEDVVWDARFVDVLTTLPDGTRQIDYRHFHEVVPLSL